MIYETLESDWDYFGYALGSLWYYFLPMTVALGQFLVTFGVASDVGVYKWWPAEGEK